MRDPDWSNVTVLPAREAGAASRPLAATCPCCGAAVDAAEILIDAGRALISHGGETATLTPFECRLVQILADRAPAIVTKEAIFDILYAGRAEGDLPQPKILDIWAFKIRRKIRRIGLDLETSLGTGVALVRIDAGEGPFVPARQRREARLAGKTFDPQVADLVARGFGLQAIARNLGISYHLANEILMRLGLRIAHPKGRRPAVSLRR